MKVQLKEYAKQGWEGLASLWPDARGYLYCISTQMPPEPQQELEKAIIQFLTEELATSKHPLHSMEKVKVWNWTQIRNWLNGLPRTRDAWLGVGVDAVRGHREHLDQLLRSRSLRYLLPEVVRYIKPEGEVWKRVTGWLATPEWQTGILIVGPSGVGKTRLALEAAEVAHNKRWRVLHAVQVGAEPDLKRLAEVVLQGQTKTVLVLDDLDQMRFELEDLLSGLVHPAEEADLKLVLLATASQRFVKDWAWNGRKKELFSAPVEFRPSSKFQQNVSLSVQAKVAPTAINHLGWPTVEELCSSRPAVALRLASVLEHRIRQLGEGEVFNRRSLSAELRSGSFTVWLGQALEADQLYETEPSVLGRPVEPSASTIAATAVLAAAPLDRAKLESVARALQEDAVPSSRSYDPAYFVDELLALGWLEERMDVLASDLDAATNELLKRVLQVRPIGRQHLRVQVLKRMLIAGLESFDVWVNMSQSIGRMRDEVDEPAFLSELDEALADWMREHGLRLVAKVKGVPPRRGAQGVGAALDSGLWAEQDTLRYLILPWIEKYGNLNEASYLLPKALSSLREVSPQPVVEATLRWLSSRHFMFRAVYVLTSLLWLEDLNKVQLTTTRNYAQAWLRKYGLHRAARSLLYTLMRRHNFFSPTVADVAFAWLKKHWKTPKAILVLGPLLQRPELEKEQPQDAIKHALAWLKKHREVLEAQFVLSPLLQRPELEEEQPQEAIKHALAWLEQHREVLEAQFVLSPLLPRPELAGEQPQEAIKHALAWLERHGNEPEAQFVLSPLLPRTELEEEQLQDAIKHALAWLERHGNEPEARFVLDPLLQRPELENEQLQEVMQYAFTWLERHGNEPEARFVLDPLLPRTEEDHLESALNRALNWLRQYKEQPAAQFLFTSILRHRSISDQVKQDLVYPALQWLQKNPHDPSRDFVMISLLGVDRLLNSEQRLAVVEASLNWFMKRRNLTWQGRFFLGKFWPVAMTTPLADEVVQVAHTFGITRDPMTTSTYRKRMKATLSDLKNMKPGAPERMQVLEEGVSLLCEPSFPSWKGSSWLLETVLQEQDLKIDQRKAILTATYQWITQMENEDLFAWTFAIQRLLKEALTPTDQKQLITLSVKWLEDRRRFQDKSWRHLFKALCETEDLALEQKAGLTEIGRAWLEQEGDEQRGHWGQVWYALGRKEGVPAALRKSYAERALVWLLSIEGSQQKEKPDANWPEVALQMLRTLQETGAAGLEEQIKQLQAQLSIHKTPLHPELLSAADALIETF